VIQLIRREFYVDAGLQKTWEHLSNVERWPTWARHIRRIELIPPGSAENHDFVFDPRPRHAHRHAHEQQGEANLSQDQPM